MTPATATELADKLAADVPDTSGIDRDWLAVWLTEALPRVLATQPLLVVDRADLIHDLGDAYSIAYEIPHEDGQGIAEIAVDAIARHGRQVVEVTE